jgi:hypothetical protein
MTPTARAELLLGDQSRKVIAAREAKGSGRGGQGFE